MKRLIYGSLVYITIIFLNISIFSYGQYIHGHHVHSCPSNVIVVKETKDTFSPKNCPQYMVSFKGNCYIHSYTMHHFNLTMPYCKNNIDCDQACDSIEAKLVVVDNPDLSCFLHTSIEIINVSPVYGISNLDDKRVRIGLRRIEKDAKWWQFQWVDGSPYDHMPTYCGGSSPWGYQYYVHSYFGIIITGTYYGEQDCPRDCNQNGIRTMGWNRLCYPSEYYGKSNVCVLSNHSNKRSVYWEPANCKKEFAFVCETKAYCEPGYYLSKSQRKNPYFRNELLDGDLDGKGPVLGECKICPLGTYHEQKPKRNNDYACTPCDDGHIAIPGAVNASCGGSCPAGHYCPDMTMEHAGNETVVPCPAGTYNNEVNSNVPDSCIPTPSGTFTNTSASTTFHVCPPGVCGSAGNNSTDCDSPCPPGHYCTEGTACLGSTLNLDLYPDAKYPLECGSRALYAPMGSSSCIDVPEGFYSYGGYHVNATSSIKICEVKNYCIDGIKYPCPNNTTTKSVGATLPTHCVLPK